VRIAYLLGVIIAVLVCIVIIVALVVLSVKSAQQRKALEQIREQIRERYGSGLALVRYVQLNRQCSEEVAYQRLATFVKHHEPFDDHSSIDRMVAHDRQGLLEKARRLLVDDPDAIDKI
jgi:predicted small secreted protein